MDVRLNPPIIAVTPEDVRDGPPKFEGKSGIARTQILLPITVIPIVLPWRIGKTDGQKAKIFTKIGREIAVTALREWMAKIGAAASVKVNWFGKIKTIVQMTAIPMLLYFDPIFGLPIAWIGTVLIYIAAILTIYSMCVYMSAAWPHLQQQDQRRN